MLGVPHYFQLTEAKKQTHEKIHRNRFAPDSFMIIPLFIQTVLLYLENQAENFSRFGMPNENDRSQAE